MTTLRDKFKALEIDTAPGQEGRQDMTNLDAVIQGEKFEGRLVDFSHGDVNAFPPVQSVLEVWRDGFDSGTKQAYTEYRGSAEIREGLADRLGEFTGYPVIAESELIITPGTQGALFLALGATVSSGTKVAVVEPDYFANRKLVRFFDGVMVSIPLYYQEASSQYGIDLNRLEEAFKNGVEVFVFSNPNNPTGIVYSQQQINSISELAARYNVTVIVDQLYSRLLYSNESYTHLRACDTPIENIITIMGPSKTESLSGFRIGTAFGTTSLIERMERLQAIVSLRAPGYSQKVLETWFREPSGWLEKRIHDHEVIRDALLTIFTDANYPTATPQAGSYLFPQLPSLRVDASIFIQLLRSQAKVIVTPGTEFASTLNDSIRLNFSQDYTAAVDGVVRIVKMVEEYRI